MTTMQAATAWTSERDAFYDRNGGFNKAALWERLHGSVIARPTARHGNFQRYLKTFGLMTMVAVSASLAMPMGKAQASGNFSLTCNNLKLQAVNFSKTAMLSADCKRMDPTKKPLHASINLNNYIVDDKQRHLNWATHGDFQQTCSQSQLQWMGGVFLYSVCGIFTNGIDLDEHIANIDGSLKYFP
jgi:hypothetical protein